MSNPDILAIFCSLQKLMHEGVDNYTFVLRWLWISFCISFVDNQSKNKLACTLKDSCHEKIFCLTVLWKGVTRNNKYQSENIFSWVTVSVSAGMDWFIDINVNSLLPKIEEIRFTAKKSKAIVIGITETKLDGTIFDAEIYTECCSIVWCDR